MDNISSILESAGLTAGESKVYLALIELNSSSVGAIIQKSGVSASKVYEILNKLIKKGIVSYITDEGKKIYTAQDPGKLIDFLKEQEKKIEESKIAINSIIPELRFKKSEKPFEPTVQVFEGRKGFMSIYETILNELEDGGKFYTYTNLAVTLEFENYFRRFNELRQKKKVTMYIVYQKSCWNLKKEKQEERSKRAYYFPKVCMNEDLIPTTIAINSKACLITMVTDKIVAVLIRNKAMIEGYKKYFKYVWSISKTPQGYREFKGELF